MKLKDLCRSAMLNCPSAAEEVEILSIESDSRYVSTGAMFVCIRGLHTDGHTHAGQACERGAVCLVIEEDTTEKIPDGIIVIKTKNTRRALAHLYHAWYGFPTRRMKMIGVTGTNGKTSVTHMLRAILEASLCRCGLIGTVGCESAGRHLNSQSRESLANMTTPDPRDLYRILREMADDGVEYVLMEVTSHALTLEKLAPIEFEAAIFTNLTPEHLDFHGTMDAYADAKARLFAKSRLAIVNGDSPYAGRMTADTSARVVRCGRAPSSHYTAESIEQSDGGVTYLLCSEKSHVRISCPIPGAFSVINSMQAAACALELGFGATAVKDGLSSLTGVKGRMERVRLGIGADFTLLIDYAHTPDALENLLRCARQVVGKGHRVVLLFGCGGDRDRSKRPMMGRIAADNADYLIITSDNSRGEDPQRIIDEILLGVSNGTPHIVIPDRREAIRHAVLTAKGGDLILLAGKGHEEYEITSRGRAPFYEKEIAKEAFEERRRRANSAEVEESEP